MTADLFDVICVRIEEPHDEMIMARDETRDNAEAIMKFAVMRRGVDIHFFVVRPAAARANHG